MLKVLVVGIALNTAGCSPKFELAPATDTKPDEKGRGPRAERGDPPARHGGIGGVDVVGAWDIVSFEGHQPQRLSGTKRAAFADFHERGVSLSIECNHSGRAGTVINGRFVASDNREAMQTVMGCGPEREARESRYFSFFEKNPTVERVSSHRIRLRAGGSELVLERPAVRRLRFVPMLTELQGKWRMLDLTRYMRGGGYTGAGLSEVPGRIVISGDKLFYSRCPQYGVTFRLTGNGKLEKTGGGGVPTNPQDCRDLRDPAPARDLPAAADVLRLLHADPAVEKTNRDSLLLSTEALGLLITKAPCESREQSDDHRLSWVRDCASPE